MHKKAREADILMLILPISHPWGNRHLFVILKAYLPEPCIARGSEWN